MRKLNHSKEILDHLILWRKTMASTKKILEKLSSSEHMPWVQGRKGYLFQSTPVEINADPASIWTLVKDPNHYYEHSHGAVWAHVDGEVAVPNNISLKLFKDKFVGNLIPRSDEKISTADDKAFALGWERKLPFGGTTERYQVLEPSADGTKTMSYIALKVPGIIGFFTNLVFKKTIENSFNELNAGIKEEAEKPRPS